MRLVLVLNILSSKIKTLFLLFPKDLFADYL